jgi:hypothetical protein
MKMTPIILGLIVLGLLFLSYIVGYKVEEKHHIKTTSINKCPISFHKERLKRCITDLDCNSCLNKKCIDVKDDYKYTMEGQALSVPNGRWCLTPKITELKCNPQTGDSILAKRGKEFVWKCNCKYPAIVRNAGPFGDCSEVVACDGGDLVCPSGESKCVAGEKWTEKSSWDPTLGICKCSEGYKFLDQEGQKLCVKDQCFPGFTNDRGHCICPKPEKIDGEWKSYTQFKGKCIKDPCNPHGYFNGKKCICDKGSINNADILSPIQASCKSPCSGDENPCKGKGKCYLNDKGEPKCKDCYYPHYQDKSGMCNAIVKHGNVECKSNIECETRACGKTLAPLSKIGNGKKYCSPW